MEKEFKNLRIAAIRQEACDGESRTQSDRKGVTHTAIIL